MRCPVILLCALFLFTSSLAQKQANVWYFSSRAAIDFNDGKRTALLGGKVSLGHVNACISNKNGVLQFYTDLETFYNRDNEVMANGNDILTKGPGSYTQTVIVPLPESEVLYYIFYIGSEPFEQGKTIYRSLLYYSIVDMRLDNGRGAVTTKNILLFNNSTQRLSAVHHANGSDVWLVSHEGGSNVFLSYLITANGVEPEPVRSAVGNEHGGYIQFDEFEDFIGQIKLSPDGKRIGVTHSFKYKNEPPSVRLFDFDNKAGKVSNARLVFQSEPNEEFYPIGLEFSPNSQMLYFSESNAFGLNPNIFEIRYLSQVEINEKLKRRLIYSGTQGAMGMLQLGPDGMIYCSFNKAIGVDDPESASNGYLATINCPNAVGEAASFTLRGFDLYDFNNSPAPPQGRRLQLCHNLFSLILKTRKK